MLITTCYRCRGTKIRNLPSFSSLRSSVVRTVGIYNERGMGNSDIPGNTSRVCSCGVCINNAVLKHNLALGKLTVACVVQATGNMSAISAIRRETH